jgi:hypothetical protein
LSLRAVLRGLWLLAVLAPLAAAAGDDPAAARLALFLDAHGHQSGLPDEATAAAMGDAISAGLASDIAVARVAQAEFMRDHPDEKPPFIEGPIFNSSAYEPYTGYEIIADPAFAGQSGADGERRVLRVRFVDDTATPAADWHDEFVLVHERGAWRIDDVRYGAGFDFSNHGTLRQNLQGEALSPAPLPQAGEGEGDVAR